MCQHSIVRWFFNADFPLPKSNVGSLRFFNGIFRAWESIRQALVFLPPKTYTQFMRQPLIWNPLFTDEAACVLGLRPRLSWAAMDNGPARTVADWINFLQTSAQDRKNRLYRLRGENIMVINFPWCIRSQYQLCNSIIFKGGTICFRQLIYL